MAKLKCVKVQPLLVVVKNTMLMTHCRYSNIYSVTYQNMHHYTIFVK